MEQPSGVFFKKDKDGNLDISMDQVSQFNEATINNTIPTGSQFVAYNNDKFDTCRFRSQNEIRYAVACCNGSNNFAVGYKCNLLRIFNIKNYDCAQCTKYQSK